MKAKHLLTIFLLSFFIAASPSFAAQERDSAPEAVASATKDDKTTPTSLPVPRFVTLAADEVNLRAGPGLRYPIKLVVHKDGLPVEITREFDVWRQIRDSEGDEGWVHKSMLSGKRAVIIKGSMQTLMKKPEEEARPLAKLEPGVIAKLGGCKQEWCRIKISSHDGWVKRKNIWGVYPDEKFEE